MKEFDSPALLALATKFNQGGCCGKKPQVTIEDLEAAGLTPIPTVFPSTLGQIIPRSGWRALCVYVYETTIKKPFPPLESLNGRDLGEVVSHAILEMYEQR